MVVGDQLTGGVAAVVDCVGSEDSLRQALHVVAPGGTVHVVGMPASVTLDLTSLWHRESSLRGCYAYTRADFSAAIDLVREKDLGRLVSATYPLSRYEDAIDHAANAGARGAVKIAFDLRLKGTR
jgi:threonine dehydrogenase-like Zn-dependent dehydrogenase